MTLANNKKVAFGWMLEHRRIQDNDIVDALEGQEFYVYGTTARIRHYKILNVGQSDLMRGNSTLTETVSRA